jgi:hypothetical protein
MKSEKRFRKAGLPGNLRESVTTSNDESLMLVFQVSAVHNNRALHDDYVKQDQYAAETAAEGATTRNCIRTAAGT